MARIFRHHTYDRAKRPVITETGTRPARGSIALALLAVILTASVALPAGASSPTQPATASSPPRTEAPAQGKFDEPKVLDFIGQHQPKLLKLLDFLKDKQPALYAQALKEMSRSQQRLESLANRDQELYNVELQLWQVRSELRLLAAELTATSPSRRAATKPSSRATTDRQAELEQLVEQEAAHELARLQLLHTRAKKELTRLETQIEALTADPEQQIARKLQLWQNRIHKGSRK